MDKEVLIQYCEMKEEIKDLRQRIMKLDKFLEKPPIVADTVTGSRKDLTIGPIKITGIPESEVCPQEKRENAVQGVVGGKRSGTFGADLPSRGIHRQHPEIRAADYVPVVLH